MKAIRLVAIGEPLEAREIPVTDPREQEVLVRVEAAGICHSDAHYRAGTSPAGPPPIPLGHEVAGVIEKAGAAVSGLPPGDRVCLHYLVTCGACFWCSAGNEQFCPHGQMLGKHRDGGYAEFITVPARNAVPLPAELSSAAGALMMCSSATSFHALRKARLAPGETVAVFGVGGLGLSAVQLARACGALDVFAVDLDADKLRLAAGFGARPIHAGEADPVEAIRAETAGRGVDVALELIGLPQTMQQAVRSLAILGRAALAGITALPFAVDSYQELIGKEGEVIGVSDHLLSELPLLIELVRRGALDLDAIVSSTVPLEEGAINSVLDDLEQFRGEVRAVITPTSR